MRSLTLMGGFRHVSTPGSVSPVGCGRGRAEQLALLAGRENALASYSPFLLSRCASGHSTEGLNAVQSLAVPPVAVAVG